MVLEVALSVLDRVVVLSFGILYLCDSESISHGAIEKYDDVDEQNCQCNTDQNPSALIPRFYVRNEVSEDNKSISADQAHRLVEDLSLVL